MYFKTFKGPGGLPVGVSGNVITSLKTEEDCLAALLVMKRGCAVFLSEDSDKSECVQKYSPIVIRKISDLDNYLDIPAFLRKQAD